MLMEKNGEENDDEWNVSSDEDSDELSDWETSRYDKIWRGVILSKSLKDEDLAKPIRIIGDINATKRHSQGRNTVVPHGEGKLLFQSFSSVHEIDLSTTTINKNIVQNKNDRISTFCCTEKYITFSDLSLHNFYVKNLETNEIYQGDVYDGYRYNTMMIVGDMLYGVGQTRSFSQFFINNQKKSLELKKVLNLGSYGNHMDISHDRKYLVTTMDRGGAHFHIKKEKEEEEKEDIVLYDHFCKLHISRASDFIRFNSTDTVFAVASQDQINIYLIINVIKEKNKCIPYRTLRNNNIYNDKTKPYFNHRTCSLLKFHPTNPNLLAFNGYSNQYNTTFNNSNFYLLHFEKNEFFINFELGFQTSGLCFSSSGKFVYIVNGTGKSILEIKLSPVLLFNKKKKTKMEIDDLSERIQFLLFIDDRYSSVLDGVEKIFFSVSNFKIGLYKSFFF